MEYWARLRNSCLGLVGLLALAPAGHSAEVVQRFRPPHPDYVVLQLTAAESEQTFRRLRNELKQAALDSHVAQRVAGHYLALARSTREPRYFGRAEAVLEPWLAKPAAPPGLLLLQADILQNRHDFSGALQLLDRAIAQDPRAVRARLLRATLVMVQGDPMRARSDCAALMGWGETSIGTVCLAQSLAAMGQLERARAMIELILSRKELPDSATRAWAQTSLADIASRRGESATAERYWRAALALSPQDEFIRCALSDLLVARGATAEALTLLALPRPSVGILVRQVLAHTVSRDHASRRATRAQLEELLRLESQRGERVHLREETLLALGEALPVEEALRLAKANFTLQREPIDVRLLARAALNAGDRATLADLRHWCLRTGFRDRKVDELLERART